jgi:prevent-host-death family protein
MLRLTDRVVSISHLKTHAAALLRELGQHGEPIVVTQNGAARAVLLDVAAFDALQEAAAMGRLLALGERQWDEGLVQEAGAVIDAFRRADG